MEGPKSLEKQALRMTPWLLEAQAKVDGPRRQRESSPAPLRQGFSLEAIPEETTRGQDTPLNACWAWGRGVEVPRPGRSRNFPRKKRGSSFPTVLLTNFLKSQLPNLLPKEI